MICQFCLSLGFSWGCKKLILNHDTLGHVLSASHIVLYACWTSHVWHGICVRHSLFQNGVCFLDIVRRAIIIIYCEINSIFTIIFQELLKRDAKSNPWTLAYASHVCKIADQRNVSLIMWSSFSLYVFVFSFWETIVKGTIELY